MSLPKIVDTSHLFWNQYPYKVVLPYQRHHIAGIQEYNLLLKIDMDNRAHLIEVAKRYCPKNGWRILHCFSSISFFFEEEKAALHFLRSMSEKASEYHRPATVAQLETMQSNTKGRVRGNLFWAKYRWRITFRNRSVKEKDLLDFCNQYMGDRIKPGDPFDVGSERWCLTFGYLSRLYLNCESDVILAKLAHGHHISLIETVILHKEIQQNEQRISETVTGKRHSAKRHRSRRALRRD